MKLGETTSADTANIEEVSRGDIQLLWSDDWYDGPLSGMAEVNGKRYLFDVVDRDAVGAENEQRTFWLIKLDAEQLDDEEQWHELFCQNVGTHFDFTGRPPLPRDQVNMDAFYEPYKKRPRPDYRENLVVGWFRL